MSIELEKEISAALSEAGLTGAGFLAWVSGGVDSVCLVRLMALLKKEGKVGRLEIAHVDHGLRNESGRDADFVASLAGALDLPFHLVKLEGRDFPSGSGLQESARAARRIKLEEIRSNRGLDAMALAHHADDQAETVLFRILRGAGPRGAGGMRVWSPPYFRPLLNTKKAALAALALEEGWNFREDPSNATPKYTRNRVRNELLPLAEELAPNAGGALVRFANLIAQDDDLLTRLALAEFDGLARAEPEGFAFRADDLRRLEAPLRRRLFLAAVARLGSRVSRFDLSHLAAIERLLFEGGHRVAPVPRPPVFAIHGQDFWVYDPALLLPPDDMPGKPRLRHGISSGDRIPAGSLAVGLPDSPIPGEIRFRFRRDGDRLGPDKVKDLLMEARIPRWRRNLCLIAEDSSGPLALFAPGRAFGLPVGEGDSLWVGEGWWHNKSSG